MAKEDIVRGLLFEKKFSSWINGKVQPGSGSTVWAKLDVKSSKFMVSCKSTKLKSFSLKKDLFTELKQHMTGVGGEGLDRLPVLAIELDGEVYIVQPCDDWLDLITSNEPTLAADKNKQKRIDAKTPAIWRKKD